MKVNIFSIFFRSTYLSYNFVNKHKLFSLYNIREDFSIPNPSKYQCCPQRKQKIFFQIMHRCDILPVY